MFDGAEFGRQMAAEVKNIIAPLCKKIEYLEAKILELQEPMSIIKCGKGEPDEEGNIGDVYIDTDTGDLYQFKS